MSEQSERNKALVLEYMEKFRTFDPEQYYPYLEENPTYLAGANEYLAVLADGDWVAVLLKRRAITNKGEDYENVYTMFYEVIDGKIATQVEMLDFRVSGDKFDLSVLPPR